MIFLLLILLPLQNLSSGCSVQDSLTVRNAHAMAYNQHEATVMLFGGADERQVLGDLWAWDGEVWRSLSTEGLAPRTFPSLAYDNANKQLILYGGNRVLFGTDEETDTFLNDMWVWNGETWHQIDSETPPARAEASMAYDNKRKRIVLFGGYRNEDGERIRLGDTWEWDGKAWHEVVSAKTEGRFNSSMVYDIKRQSLIRFGGWIKGDRVGDTWSYNGNRWKKVTDEGPSPRNHSSMVYDIQREVIVLFGGHNGDYVFGDTWEWNGKQWIQKMQNNPRMRIYNGH